MRVCFVMVARSAHKKSFIWKSYFEYEHEKEEKENGIASGYVNCIYIYKTMLFVSEIASGE